MMFRKLLMMKLRLTAMIVMTLTVLQIQAQDKKAEEVLKSVVDNIGAYKNFKTELSYTMVNTEMNINEKKTGLLYVEGDKYRIEMEGQIIISDGKTIWTIVKDSEEVMISSAEDNDESISPTKILTTYTDYKAKFDKSHTFNNSALKTIELKPKQGEKFEKLTMVVNTQKKSLESFSVFDKNGNIFTYHIINLRPNLELPPNTFHFDAKDFPGYEIVDMR